MISMRQKQIVMPNSGATHAWRSSTKQKECDRLQQFSRQFGMRWRIFYFQGFHEKHFTCLKPGERILGIDKF